MAGIAVKPDKARPHLLSDILSEPRRVRDLGVREWEQIIWQARNSELIGQLQSSLQLAGLLEVAPPAAQRHLAVAADIAHKHAEAVQWELRGLQEALAPLDVQVVLLKGAAYCALRHPASVGRIFNDIDILVPRASLDAVEVALTRAGWIGTHANVYDERYYREWMHEIPPLEHKNRSTVLDVHHTILAPTSGIRPDPQLLLAAALPLSSEFSFFGVLAPQDMVMHSSCHLFFGEFHKGLRDLYDLHLLLSDFGSDPVFWERLRSRSETMGLAIPVMDAVQHAQRLFRTSVPAGYLQSFAARPLQDRWLRKWLFDQVLRPPHPSADSAGTRFAHWLAFARSHWLRMPLPMLVYHLSHKLIADR